MTSEQQAVLEAFIGRAITQDDVLAVDTYLIDPDNRNDVAVLNFVNSALPSQVGTLSVDDVFDQLYTTGDYVTLKQAHLQGNPVAALAFSALYDAKQIGKNQVNFAMPLTQALMTQLVTAGLMTAEGRQALETRATQKVEEVTLDALSRALNIAEGRMVL
jgi:hypothetical protein